MRVRVAKYLDYTNRHTRLCFLSLSIIPDTQAKKSALNPMVLSQKVREGKDTYLPTQQLTNKILGPSVETRKSNNVLFYEWEEIERTRIIYYPIFLRQDVHFPVI